MRRKFIPLLIILLLIVQGCRVILETPAPDGLPLATSNVPASETAVNLPPPTATPTPLPSPTATLPPPPEGAYPPPEMLQSLATPAAEASGQGLIVLNTPVPTPTPTQPALRLSIQNFSPVYTRAFRYEALGCGWMGVAGQIFDRDGRPMTGLVVSVVGNVAGQNLDALGFTGLVTDYGPAGYEIKLADRVAPAIFWIQVYDIQGNPLSEAFMLQMGGTDCNKNLAIVNFLVDVAAAYNQRLYLPLVGR